MHASRRGFIASTAIVAGFVVVLLSLRPSAAHGQGQLSPGTRVRLTAPQAFAGRVVGRLTQADSGSLTLVLRTRDTLEVPRAAITIAEASAGHNRAGWAALGMLAGAAIGAALGAVCVEVCSTSDNDANLAVAGGFIVGIPVGLLVGLVAAPERWRAVPH